MKYRVTLNGRPVEVEETASGILLGGRRFANAELHQIGEHAAEMRIGERTFRLNVLRSGGAGARGKDTFALWVNGERFEVEVLNERAMAIEKFAGVSGERSTSQRLIAPMPGLVVRVNVAVGDTVAAGHGLIVMEAMKMENELRASRAGVVRSIHVEAGRAVEKGTLLVELDPS